MDVESTTDTGTQPAIFPPSGNVTPTISLVSTPTIESVSVQPVIVEPYCRRYGQSSVYVTKNQPLILKWRWDAKTEALVQEHINTATNEILLDGALVDASQQSAIEYISDQNLYRVSWISEPIILESGTHQASRGLTWSRMISDGWDTYGPGGTYETILDDCEIIVK